MKKIKLNELKKLLHKKVDECKTVDEIVNLFLVLGMGYFVVRNLVNNMEEIKMVEGRCMKCKIAVQIQNGREQIMKNGMKAVSGVCPNCGTKVFRIIGKA